MGRRRKKEDDMRYWRIEQMSSGLVMGVYPGATEAEALLAMHRDAGCADAASADEHGGGDTLRVTEVGEPAAQGGGRKGGLR